jgi:hypothetical protein
MATFCYRRPVYFQEPADEFDELGNHEMALPMNELQTQLEEVRAQVQTNSNAIIFLQEQLKMGAETGVPFPPVMEIQSDMILGAVGTIDVVITWAPVSGLTEIALFWDGARLLPGPAPTDSRYSFNVPMTTSPTQENYEYGIRVRNAYGTSYTRIQGLSTLTPGPNPVTATQLQPKSATINGVWQVNWIPRPMLLPRVLGYRLYFRKQSDATFQNSILKDDLAAALTNTTTITLSGYTPGNYFIYVTPIFTLPVDSEFTFWQREGSKCATITIT